MRIQKLPPSVANQIAAGEVIERPASVVKELLENCLDACAEQISIDIGYGGLNQVKISDNGIGIPAEDLPLAIAPHATSKITQLQDLYAIASMGFRGEALASIASISRLSISSKPGEQEYAMMLSTEGGEVFSLSPCARSQGTTIDVRDIFFNTPVRKKFLKPERIEFQAIEMVVKRFALSAPHIAINLSHNTKLQFSLAPATCDQTRLQRIRKLLGKTFIEQANYFDAEHAGMRLYGWVSTQDYQRSQSDKLWFYINGRIVKDKLLNHAIKQAYESILYPGRHPACLLYFSLSPDEVDVNVHPTKHEVRFQQPRLVHDFISSQIQKALNLSGPKQEHDYLIPMKREEPRILQLREPYSPPPPLVEKPIATLEGSKSWLVLNKRYSLIFLQEGPYLVDLCGLQRHWLLAYLAIQDLPLPSRPLLVPLSHSLGETKLETLNHYREVLAQVGIQMDLASERSLIIRTLPIAVPQLVLKPFLIAVFSGQLPTNMELLQLLASHQSFDMQQANSDEMSLLSDYFQTLPSDTRRAFSKYLSPEICSEFLNA